MPSLFDSSNGSNDIRIAIEDHQYLLYLLINQSAILILRHGSYPYPSLLPSPPPHPGQSYDPSGPLYVIIPVWRSSAAHRHTSNHYCGRWLWCIRRNDPGRGMSLASFLPIHHMSCCYTYTHVRGEWVTKEGFVPCPHHFVVHRSPSKPVIDFSDAVTRVYLHTPTITLFHDALLIDWFIVINDCCLVHLFIAIQYETHISMFVRYHPSTP